MTRRGASATTRCPRRAPITRSGMARSAWLTSEPEEPFLGKQYLPRKFKIGFVIPPYNDIDVYTQDLGFIAIAPWLGRLQGYQHHRSAAAWVAPTRPRDLSAPWSM